MNKLGTSFRVSLRRQCFFFRCQTFDFRVITIIGSGLVLTSRQDVSGKARDQLQTQDGRVSLAENEFHLETSSSQVMKMDDEGSGVQCLLLENSSILHEGRAESFLKLSWISYSLVRPWPLQCQFNNRESDHSERWALMRLKYGFFFLQRNRKKLPEDNLNWNFMGYSSTRLQRILWVCGINEDHSIPVSRKFPLFYPKYSPAAGSLLIYYCTLLRLCWRIGSFLCIHFRAQRFSDAVRLGERNAALFFRKQRMWWGSQGLSALVLCCSVLTEHCSGILFAFCTSSREIFLWGSRADLYRSYYVRNW